MEGFWEEAFRGKKEMWGMEPAKSAILAADFFRANKAKNILIPGIGYGRNAGVFSDQGMKVTGIEISQTAVDLAKRHFGNSLTIYQGSVTDMPFDDERYDGIFCYGLIHLLDKPDREKLIKACFSQLAENGFMVFTAITKKAETYGKGTLLSKDRFEMFGGVSMFFYDEDTLREEFGSNGLFEIAEITENYPFYLIKCQKGPLKLA